MTTQPSDVFHTVTPHLEVTSPTPASDVPRLQPGPDESDSEDDRPCRSMGKAPEPSHAPTVERLDAEIVALTSSAQALTIPDSSSLFRDPIDPNSFLRDIIVTHKCQLLFLGESPTRALPLAIGIMRGSLEGIRATCYHHSQDTSLCKWHIGDKVNVDKAIKNTRARIVSNNGDRGRLQLKGIDLPPKQKIDDDFDAFRCSTGDTMLRCLCGEADATKLAKSLVVRKFRQDVPFVIWFQCPWTSPSKPQLYTEELLRMFMTSAFTLSHLGGIVLVIRVITAYDYGIQDLKKIASANGFKHFEDKNFIRECILYGYRHCRWDGTDGTHARYLKDHLSHIFIKEMEGGSRSGAGEE